MSILQPRALEQEAQTGDVDTPPTRDTGATVGLSGGTPGALTTGRARGPCNDHTYFSNQTNLSPVFCTKRGGGSGGLEVGSDPVRL